MPLIRRIPKFGFKNRNRVEYTPVNLDTLERIANKFNVSVIDFDILRKAGVVSKNDKVKILGRGELTKKLEVHAHAFSKSAKAAIEAQQGKAVLIK